MNERRNDFEKHNRKITPAACDGIKWRYTQLELTLARDKWEVGRGTMSRRWSGWGVECAHEICAHLPLLCCPTPQKVRNGNCERGCEGKLILKSQVKVVEGG